MILPLPLVPFEEYMLEDDRPQYPMSFFIRFHFQGRLDRSALESALETALARHVLLSVVVKRIGGRLHWVEAEDHTPAIRWIDNRSADGHFRITGIDLRTEPGLKLWVDQREQTASLLFQFHHACCDGLGAFQLIKDLLVSYAQAGGETSKPATLRPVEADRLYRRGSFGLSARKLPGLIPKQMVGLLGAREFLMRTPVPLASDRAEPATEPLPDTYPATYAAHLHQDELVRLRAAAKRRGVTTNDLLTRDLLLAIGDWRSRRGLGHNNRWLRLSIPINLRTAGDQQMPAANVVSMVFFHCKPRQLADPDRLLARIHGKMRRVRQLRLGLTFVLWLRVFEALPGGLARMTRPGKCVATSVLSNLGKPLGNVPLPRRDGRVVVGNVILEGMDILAPIRPNTAAVFCVFKYARQLCITLHYDPRHLTAEAAEELLATFMGRIRESIRPT